MCQWKKGDKVVKHCHSPANSSGLPLSTPWYQCWDGSGYKSQPAVVTVAQGQGVKAGDLALHLLLPQWGSTHIQLP